ncbi:glutamine amidotransferase-related protein [Martelella alba]|nr:gamma-glutamyl-gamma-aminobutyrate hydrolase family protein [Martelella alba]
MTIILAVHDTPEPAFYGLMAATAAAERRLPLFHLAADYDIGRYPDACQHVLRAGGLVVSGLLWLERLAGRSPGQALTITACVQQAAGGDGVIPIGPSQRKALPLLTDRLAREGLPYRIWRTVARQNGLVLEDQTHGRLMGDIWRPDAFSRWRRDVFAMATGRRPVRIALIGDRRDQTEAYPATLAALGDAADALNIAVEVLFAAPKNLPRDPAAELSAVDGILLPGGSDMGNVPGQLAAARHALQHKVPTLGLCLGMQTMATAALRQTPRWRDANLAEACPDAPVKTFVPLCHPRPYGPHRLGEHAMRLRAGSQLAAILSTHDRLRYNHRYQLNPELLEGLSACGLTVSATDAGGAIADAVELADHPFYLGVQGHPELSSRQGAAHPLLVAWLSAAANPSR